MYKSGPLRTGTEQQGTQLDPLAPAQIYRTGLAEMDAHCRELHGKPFAELEAAEQDSYLSAMEEGRHSYPTIKSERLFALMLANALEGFFADPIYGGNKDMAGWKMIGFPGARYDYRDVAEKKGRRLDIPPVSLAGRL
ncbi:gluconate 2-dehydrogenase subunit 3 family protein [Thioclava sp. GXIMD4215]|uniref:gluconate 2-dehydrogenase subunit 3 family protein n=1 Tax=Thioclava sp. GXIMD4215 TaxID=3131928 RepID=UPI00311AECB1